MDWDQAGLGLPGDDDDDGGDDDDDEDEDDDDDDDDSSDGDQSGEVGWDRFPWLL